MDTTDLKKDYDNILKSIQIRNTYNRNTLKTLSSDIQTIQNIYFDIFKK